MELRSRRRRRLWASGIRRRAVPGLWGDTRAKTSGAEGKAGRGGAHLGPNLGCADAQGWRRRVPAAAVAGLGEDGVEAALWLRIFTGECCVGLRFPEKS